MIPGEGRRSFVLSVTLTELALLLFFLLLLTAVWQLKRETRKGEMLDRKVEELQKAVSQMSGMTPGEIQKLVEETFESDSTRAQNKNLSDRVGELENQIVGMASQLQDAI